MPILQIWRESAIFSDLITQLFGDQQIINVKIKKVKISIGCGTNVINLWNYIFLCKIGLLDKHIHNIWCSANLHLSNGWFENFVYHLGFAILSDDVIAKLLNLAEIDWFLKISTAILNSTNPISDSWLVTPKTLIYQQFGANRLSLNKSYNIFDFWSPHCNRHVEFVHPTAPAVKRRSLVTIWTKPIGRYIFTSFFYRTNGFFPFSDHHIRTARHLGFFKNTLAF